MFGAAAQADTCGDRAAGFGNDAHRFDIQERLVQGPREQQACAAHIEALAVGTVAAVVEPQLTTGVHVVADMHMALNLGGEAEAGEVELVLTHFHVDIHGHGHRRFALFGLAADDHRVVGNLNGRRRQLAHGDVATGDMDLAGDRQLVVLEADFQVGRHFQLGVGLHGDRQLRAFEAEVDHQGAAPVDLARKATLAGLAAAPAAVELHAFAGDLRLQVQAFEADGQFRPGDFAVHQVQVAVDQGREQTAGDAAIAVEFAAEFFHHGYKGPRYGEVQTRKAEIAGDRLVARQRIDLRLQQQLAKLAATEI